ncbi:hypothetical protein E2C01_016794 [Portunus trituberculatus]|uniref:Uncharacterized protein n=1 Tax=Portunus trituberculatus TaxID=210409 RepID=A0A5B7DRW3_PORTR|nr:hypothetical protein [Portunus trituberculatus]
MVKNICLCNLYRLSFVLFENLKHSITRAGSGVKVFICGATEASIVCVCLVKKRMKGGASRIDCIEVIDRRRHSANTGCFKGKESAPPESLYNLLLFIPDPGNRSFCNMDTPFMVRPFVSSTATSHLTLSPRPPVAQSCPVSLEHLAALP